MLQKITNNHVFNISTASISDYKCKRYNIKRRHLVALRMPGQKNAFLPEFFYTTAKFEEYVNSRLGHLIAELKEINFNETFKSLVADDACCRRISGEICDKCKNFSNEDKKILFLILLEYFKYWKKLSVELNQTNYNLIFTFFKEFLKVMNLDSFSDFVSALYDIFCFLRLGEKNGYSYNTKIKNILQHFYKKIHDFVREEIRKSNGNFDFRDKTNVLSIFDFYIKAIIQFSATHNIDSTVIRDGICYYIDQPGVQSRKFVPIMYMFMRTYLSIKYDDLNNMKNKYKNNEQIQKIIDDIDNMKQ